MGEQNEQTQGPDYTRQLWGRQKALVRTVRLANELGAPDKDTEDKLNRNVAELVEAGEVTARDAWSLSIGENPYLLPSDFNEDE